MLIVSEHSFLSNCILKDVKYFGVVESIKSSTMILTLPPGTFNLLNICLVFVSDMIHVFSSVPRDFNFVDHTSDLGWKEWVHAI